MKMNISNIDIDTALENYGNDTELYLIVLRTFLESTPAVLDKLRSASKETIHNCYVNIHGIKGELASIYANKLRDEAAYVETFAKQGDLTGLNALLAPFLERIERFLCEISEWFREFDSNH